MTIQSKIAMVQQYFNNNHDENKTQKQNIIYVLI